MPKSRLEIADIFRTYGPAWRRANKGHVNLSQLKVMSSIEACRTEALGPGMWPRAQSAVISTSPTIPARTGTVPNAKVRRHAIG